MNTALPFRAPLRLSHKQLFSLALFCSAAILTGCAGYSSSNASRSPYTDQSSKIKAYGVIDTSYGYSKTKINQ